MKKGFLNPKQESSTWEQEKRANQSPPVPFPTGEVAPISEYSDWSSLLSKKPDQVHLIQKLKDLSALQDRKEFNDCYYINFRQFGLSFCFKKSHQVNFNLRRTNKLLGRILR